MDNESTSDRSPIPEPMKREVRQRCGFGCVICGLPLYTYEHMLGYANVERHVADELTLLCDKHQRERTNKLLPIEHVLRANQDPYNLRKGVSTPYTFHYDGPNCTADIGTNVFSFQDRGDSTEFIALAIDEDPLISFRLDRGNWLLSLNVFDRNDELMLLITDNELIYSIIPWDIELVGHNLVIREAQRNILVDILFEPPSRIKIQRGHFMHNGIEIEIKPDYLELMNKHNRYSYNRGNGWYGMLFGNMVNKHVPWSFYDSVPLRFLSSQTNSLQKLT